MQNRTTALPEFHPHTVIRDWGNGDCFRISDALTGVCVFGATGSGKTSGPAKHLAYGYLAAGFGGLVLCAKKEERIQWQKWAAETGRTDDLVIVDASGKWRFNFLDWEASRPGEGGGLSMNIVNILDEVATAVAGNSGPGESTGGGDSKFWTDALHHLNTNVVDLTLLAEIPIKLSLLRSILNTAPYSKSDLSDAKWQKDSTCFASLQEAERKCLKRSAERMADFEECKAYWTKEFPALTDRVRSIITLTFSMLIRPLVTTPLRQIFSTETNVKPEDAFNGKIIIVDLPVQEFRLVGRIASLAWKYCFQIAVLRRSPPSTGFLRPVFLWADEAQNFVTNFDAEYQAVARSAGGCTVYLTQNRESYLRVLKGEESVDSLLGNLQAKFFCQNAGETNEWAANLLGQRWIKINAISVGQTRTDSIGANQDSHNAGVNRAEQLRHFVEPAAFTTLKRGGEKNGFQVECIVYNGGHQFDTGRELLPYRLLTFNQR